MDCQEFLARHSEYLDGELSERDAERMGAHAAECGACARYDRVLRRGLALVRELEPAEPRPEPCVSLYERLARPGEPHIARGGTLAASLAAAGVLAMLAWNALPRRADEVAEAGAPSAAVVLSGLNGTSWRSAPVLAGQDVVGPILPVVPGRSVAGPFAGPFLFARVRPASVEVPGAYTPLVLDPPDYGQSIPVSGTSPTYGRD